MGRYPIPVLPKAEIDHLMSLPEGTPAPQQEEIRHAIFELLSEIIDQDPPKVPSEYFTLEFATFLDLCLQVSLSLNFLIKFKKNTPHSLCGID